MTCYQLGGACDQEFVAATFEEMADLSKAHGMEMFKKGDGPHLEAMRKMKERFGNPEAFQKWYEDRRKEFEGLPEI